MGGGGGGGGGEHKDHIHRYGDIVMYISKPI